MSPMVKIFSYFSDLQVASSHIIVSKSRSAITTQSSFVALHPSVTYSSILVANVLIWVFRLSREVYTEKRLILMNLFRWPILRARSSTEYIRLPYLF